MRFEVYKNSLGATLLSLLGSGLIFCGICLLFATEFIAAIVCMVIGIIFSQVLAEKVSNDKDFKLWVKHLESQGIPDAMRSSVELCMEVYKARPNKQTLSYIDRYNPTAANAIYEERFAKK